MWFTCCLELFSQISNGLYIYWSSLIYLVCDTQTSTTTIWDVITSPLSHLHGIVHLSSFHLFSSYIDNMIWFATHSHTHTGIYPYIQFNSIPLRISCVAQGFISLYLYLFSYPVLASLFLLHKHTVKLLNEPQSPLPWKRQR